MPPPLDPPLPTVKFVGIGSSITGSSTTGSSITWSSVIGPSATGSSKIGLPLGYVLLDPGKRYLVNRLVRIQENLA